MKKNVLLLLLLIGLTLAAYLGYQQAQKKENYNIDLSDRDFTVESADQIYKIKISKRTKPPITLSRNGDHWLVGEGRRVNPNTMVNILSVLENISIKYIPPKQATKNIINEVNRLGIQIDLYDINDNHFKSFFIGGNTPDERGTYFLMQGKTQPYVMQRPLVEGTLRNIFLFDEEDIYDQVFARFDINNIKKIEVDYPRDKPQSFILEQKALGFEVVPKYKTTKAILKDVNSNLGDAYLREFKELVCEANENDNRLQQRIRGAIPFASYTITTNDGKSKAFHFTPVNEYYSEDLALNDLEVVNLIKIERFFCHTSDDDIFVVQKQLIKNLFRPYSYFFEQ